jgi:hypothetical protein|tara:strand:+ start:358 stop:558 length:201 start_codon:yes stop_codon:yes gene_type:complete
MKMIIQNETGHTELIVNSEQAIEQINDHPTHWVFVDGEMVIRQDIAGVSWDTVNEVELIPAVVGGC